MTKSGASNFRPDRKSDELTDAELFEVTGGKVAPGSLSFEHLYDKATPVLAH
jgi:type VI protein secretion system component Hcp